MRVSDFRSPDAGQLITTEQGYLAFVPAAPPPELRYDAELVVMLSNADTALAELAGLGRSLPNPHLLIAPYIRREAVLSSRIEGTRTTLGELLRDEVDETPARSRSPDLQEVRNYVDALEYGIRRLREGETITLDLVRELHRRLMFGVRGERLQPGQFRERQNWIGSMLHTVFTAPYVPPPPGEVLLQSLREWEEFLPERHDMPVLIQCALMHEQFEAIHPFLDGNGRLGRVLIILFLIQRGRLPEPLLYLSDFLERYRNDYMDLLQLIRTDGDWTSWLRFFLIGVGEMSQIASGQTRALLDLREEYSRRLRTKPRALDLLDELLRNPYMTAKRAQGILGTTNNTARQAVRILEEVGMLREITGRDWNKIYLANPIMAAINPEGS